MRPIRPITQVDERTTDLDADLLMSVVADFASYEAWWPRRFNVRLERPGTPMLGARISISPLPMVTTGWELTDIVEGASIDIDYYQGWHRGTGRWSFARDADSARTRYGFAIHLEPKGRSASMLYTAANVRRMHTGNMSTLFDALEAHARTQA